MIVEIVDIFKNLFLRHKGVRTFRYQDKLLNNAQNNFLPFQIYMSTSQLHQLNITTNIFRVELNFEILAMPTPEMDVVHTQDFAYTIATDVLAAIDTWEDYKGILSLYDYDIMTIDHYTDDDSAGARMSVVLAMPSPVNLCTLDDNFNDEPYVPEPDAEITVDTKEVPENLRITPIKLPKSGC